MSEIRTRARFSRFLSRSRMLTTCFPSLSLSLSPLQQDVLIVSRSLVHHYYPFLALTCPVPNRRDRNDATASVDSAFRFRGRSSLRPSLFLAPPSSSLSSSSPCCAELANTRDARAPLLILLLVSAGRLRPLLDRATMQCGPGPHRATLAETFIAPSEAGVLVD